MKLKMKWALNNEGKKSFLGYEIMAENVEERKALGTIRNWKFWGMDDEEPIPQNMGEDMHYSGMRSENNQVTKLMWEIPKNMKRLKDGELKEPFEEIH